MTDDTTFQVDFGVVDRDVGGPADWGVFCPSCDAVIDAYDLIGGYTCDCGADLALDVVWTAQGDADGDGADGDRGHRP